MRISDVLYVLQKRLPLYTSLFNDINVIVDAVVSPNRITFRTQTPHNLKLSQPCVITEAENALQITKIINNAPFYTIETLYDHKLSLDEEDKVVEIGDEFRGIQVRLIAVNNPNSITVQTEKTLPTEPLYLILEEGFNGYNKVIGIEDDFRFVVADPMVYTPPYKLRSDALLSTSVRIMGIGDMDRFNDIYTEQNINQLWLAITPPENRASRDRMVTTDAITGYSESSIFSAQTEIRQLHIETISVYCAIPAGATMDGRSAIDIAEEVRFELYRALCGVFIFSLAYSDEIYPLMPVRDGYFSYLSDNTTYIHEFVFERSVVLTANDIGADDHPTAPFRDLDVTVIPCEDLVKNNI